MTRIFCFIILFVAYLAAQDYFSMGSVPVADTARISVSRSIDFAGYTWGVKSSTDPVGPGPNYFSDSEENVWVDSLDRLHLRITNRNNRWYCAEVILQESFGYGTYVFNTISRVGAMNENIILGLFTWDTSAPNDYYREIDIEFARWGNAQDPTNAQYVVQPYTVSGNLQRWYMPVDLDSSTHIINWQSNTIDFKALYGLQNAMPFDSVLYEWNYFGQHFHKPGNENIRMNLWLFGGNPPTDSQEQEIVISGFTYIPPEPDGIDEKITGYPRHFILFQNFPNPFNPTTAIRYRLSANSHVELDVYNILGKKVAQPVSARQSAGEYTVHWNAQNFPGGVYYYRLKAGNTIQTKKMILLR